MNPTRSKSKPKHFRRWGAVIVIVALVGYGAWALTRPLPLLKPVLGLDPLHIQTPATTINWPAGGEAAIGVIGSDSIQTHGAQTARPTASTAKLITALTVLQKYPLALNQQGPTITLTAQDVAIYNNYVTQDGSVVPVVAGEQISEYQALQAMLLPSANNVADSLAIWAYGSLPAYAAAATQFAAQHHLNATHIGSDASGLSPTTTSTAGNLVKLGKLVLANPVLAQIIDQPTANLPVGGTVKNVNLLLGQDGIVGIKTGNSDQAGGVYLSASRTTVNNKPVTVVTAVMGLPTLYDAVEGSLPFIQSAQSNFATTNIINAGSIVGRYQLPWGGSLPVVASQSLKVTTWGGNEVTVNAQLPTINPTTKKGSVVGTISSQPTGLVSQQTVPVTVQAAAGKPSIWWRLTHP